MGTATTFAVCGTSLLYDIKEAVWTVSYQGAGSEIVPGYVRTVAHATIGLEFATSPQKYILWLTDDQYDVVISDKFEQYNLTKSEQLNTILMQALDIRGMAFA